MISKRGFSCILLLVVVTFTGCLSESPPSRDWGTGLPEEDALVEDNWVVTKEEKQIVDVLLTRFVELVNCPSDHWTPEIDLRWPRTSLSVIGGCKTYQSHLDAIVERNDPDEFSGLVNESRQSYLQLISALQDLDPTVLPSLSTFLGHFSTTVLAQGGPVASPGFVVSGFEGGYIGSAERAYEGYAESGEESHLRNALRMILRVHHNIPQALMFIQAWDETVPSCQSDISNAERMLETTFQELRNSGRSYRYDMIEFVLHHNISVSFDAYYLLIQYELAHEALMDHDDPLPTMGEAIYLLNQLLEDPERPGVREFIERHVTLDLGEEFWQANSERSKRALAIHNMDWAPIFTECFEEPSS